MKPTIFPALRYKDAPAALEWLCRAFLFEKQAVFPAADGTIVHAELRRDGGVVGINSATPPVESNPWSSVLQGVYVTIDDVDAHHACAQSAGARIAITRTTLTTAHASTRRGMSRAISGALGPIRWARHQGSRVFSRSLHIDMTPTPSHGSRVRSDFSRRCRSRVPTASRCMWRCVTAIRRSC